MIIKCPECGHQVSDRAKTCPSCGIDIAGKITRCPDCGEYLFKDQHACPNCHCSINASAEEPVVEEPENKGESTETQVAQAAVKPDPRVKPAKKSHKVLWSSLIVGFVIALTIVFLGIYFYQKTQQENELRAYDNAMLSSEPAVLQNFLDMYTDASLAHRDSIKSHLKALMKIDRDWQNALASKSKSALQLFIDRNPDNVHIPEARLIIDSLDFDAAKVEDTLEGYQRYMDTHGQGQYYDEAASAYDRLKEEAERRRIQAEQDSLLNMGEAVGEGGEEISNGF